MDTKDFAAKIELERKEAEQELKEDWVKEFITKKQKEIESAKEVVKIAESNLLELKRDYDSMLLKSINEIYEENQVIQVIDYNQTYLWTYTKKGN